MSDLILDDFPDDLYDELCRRAEGSGRTVSDEALLILSESLQDELAFVDHRE